jgi:opacity protein-like surface antigen
MVDKAYVDLTKAMINAKIGLFGHGGLGMGTTTDNQGPNIMVTGDFAPVKVTALYTKLDEGTSLIDETDDDATEDQDVYGIDAKFAAEAFSAGILYATLRDEVTEGAKNVMGVFGSGNVGPVALWGEIDYFSGDDGDNIDYVGTNFTLNADMAVNEKIKVALNFCYAPGTTEDDEEQISYLTNDAAYIPLEMGPFAWIEGHGIHHFELEDNAGAMTIAANASFAVTDEITLFGLVGYEAADEEDPDDDGNSVDNVMIYTVAGTYAFMPQTKFSLQYTGLNRSVSGALEDDPVSKIMGLLTVNF